MVSDLISNSLIYTGGGSLLLGGITGFAVKKMMKVLAVIGGIGVLTLAGLEESKLISVNWDKVKEATNSTAQYMYTKTDQLVHHVAGQVDHTGMYVIGGGFITGLLVGLRMG